MEANKEQIEVAAKAIYTLWAESSQYPWQDGGNSDKQYLARKYAAAALASQAAPQDSNSPEFDGIKIEALTPAVAVDAPEPSFFVVVDKYRHAQAAVNLWHEAQEHINDACVQGVDGAGKWKAVPVFEMRPTDDKLWDQTIRDRDTYHDWADKLSDAISRHFSVDIGEHSNQNCPWAEAFDAIEVAEPPAQAPAGEPVAKCWSCSLEYTANDLAEADGDCPHCGAEIDDEDDAAPVANAVPAQDYSDALKRLMDTLGLKDNDDLHDVLTLADTRINRLSQAQAAKPAGDDWVQILDTPVKRAANALLMDMIGKPEWDLNCAAENLLKFEAQTRQPAVQVRDDDLPALPPYPTPGRLTNWWSIAEEDAIRGYAHAAIAAQQPAPGASKIAALRAIGEKWMSASGRDELEDWIDEGHQK